MKLRNLLHLEASTLYETRRKKISVIRYTFTTRLLNKLNELISNSVIKIDLNSNDKG